MNSSSLISLPVAEVGQARFDHDVILEVENAFQIAQRHVQHQADTGGQRFQEPDMRDGRGQFDMAHALAADLLQRDLHAAFLADDAAILHPLVLAAKALVVLDRPEDARAEEAVTLGLERAVVDRLGLLDLAVGPAEDALGLASETLISSKAFGGVSGLNGLLVSSWFIISSLLCAEGGGIFVRRFWGANFRTKIRLTRRQCRHPHPPPHPGVPC
jgi:hypothetical protein